MIEIKLKGISNESLLQGFPGIPATWPRIQATIELRPSSKALAKNPQAQLGVSRVIVGLYRTDSIAPHELKASLSSSKREQSFLVTKQKELFKAVSVTEALYALDLPFILSLPQNRPIVASMQLGKFVESVYYLFVTAEFGGKQASLTKQFSVPICRYDTLPTFRIYQAPIVGSAVSPDHYASLDFSLPTSAYGPLDQIRANFKISCNLDWPKARKARVKRISLELIQTIRFAAPPQPPNSGSGSSSSDKEPRPSQASATSERASIMSERSLFDDESTDAPKSRVSRVADTAEDFNDIKIDEIPFSHELCLELPLLQFAERDNIVPKDMPEFSSEGRTGFTNASSLYRVEFMLKFKVRLSHAQDIETTHPITISQFGHNLSMAYMQSIVDSAELARYAERMPPRPVHYKKPIVCWTVAIQ